MTDSYDANSEPSFEGRPRTYTIIEEEGGAARLDGDLLTYTGQDAVVIPSQVVRQYRHVARRIDLSYNCIASFEGLADFRELRELVLDNNRLKDGVKIPLLPRLETLSLNKNLITNLDPFLDALVKSCPNITFLSLLGNVACPNELSCSDKDEEDYQRYRYYVIYRLPKLKFLDSNLVTAKERQEAQRVGQFMRVVQPSADSLSKQDELARKRSQEDDPDYSPLPDTLAREGGHKGTYGVCRYVYYGRHSEGNRFIRNSDL